MKIKIKHTSYVIDFLDVGFSSDKLGEELRAKGQKILNNINTDLLQRWELIITVLYSSNDEILIFRKGKSHIEEKYKEIVVHLPIPTIDIVEWGVEKKQHIKTGMNEKILKYADRLDVDPTIHNSRENFIRYCMDIAIANIFDVGFNVNKVKVKL